jgi:hypothetical protein
LIAQNIEQRETAVRIFTMACIALPAAASLAGCASVQPWEKGNLAKPAMSFAGDPLDERFTQHIYTSKENASGGYGVGGGGCGCN